MPVAAIVSLLVIAVLVLALAAYLLRVILILNDVNDTLGKVTFGVRAIAHRTEPVGAVVSEINANLSAVAGALEALVASAKPATQAVAA